MKTALFSILVIFYRINCKVKCIAKGDDIEL